MQFAVVDIETTGNDPFQDGITEIAVLTTDGNTITDTFHTLIHPDKNIPGYIQYLTGIDDKMIEEAPTFDDVAADLKNILEDKIFVAHHVSFDYNFIREAFRKSNIAFRSKRLCTVKATRILYPRMKRYSLNYLSHYFGIENKTPHRALGDAGAAQKLLQKLLNHEHSDQLTPLLKSNKHHQVLPIHLDRSEFIELPAIPGVYYLKGKSGKPIYIGKARNIRKRVYSHFTSSSKNKVNFSKEVFSIDYKATGNELLAAIWEDHEIRMHWPRYNRAQKTGAKHYGVYQYRDQSNITRLAINKVRNNYPVIALFGSIWEARTWLINCIEQYDLNPAHCGLSGLYTEEYNGDHENGILEMLKDNSISEQSLLVMGKGRRKGESGFLYVERGVPNGIGYCMKESVRDIERTLQEDLIEVKSSPALQRILKYYLSNQQKEYNIINL